MDLGIAGRVAVVTASTRGIGLGIARALAAEGARVAVNGRTAAGAERVAAELGGIGVAADVLTEAGCDELVEEVRRRLGPISILVNNLGLRAGSGWTDTGVEEVQTAFHGNVIPAVRLSKLVLPEMERQGWGRILVISSVFGREWGGAPAYNLAKAAENSLVTTLGREVASRGVTVNAIAPGSILFEGGGWWRRREADPEGIAGFVASEMPLGRFGSVEEVAAVAAFVCSEPASLVNAAVVAVDGGQSRSII